MTSETGTDDLLIEEHGDITLITFNRPERMNAMNRETMGRPLNEYLASVNRGEYRTRCIILTGSGRAFCVGADVSTLSSMAAAERPPWRIPHLEESLAITMRQCDVPIIGAINGYAIGAGFGLALATDLRIAADDAKFQVTQIKRGVFADLGLGHFLPRDVGTQRALELMFTARMLEAQEALELGLVLKVVPRDQLVDAALEMAREIVKNGPMSLAASKRVVYMPQDEQLRHTETLSLVAIDRMFFTEDAKEGVASLVERREPQFRGR